jgi:hypothetical protein
MRIRLLNFSTDYQVRGVRSTSFGPRGHVATNGRVIFFLHHSGRGGGRGAGIVWLTGGRDGDEFPRVRAGREWIFTGSGGLIKFSEHNRGPQVHQSYVGSYRIL